MERRHRCLHLHRELAGILVGCGELDVAVGQVRGNYVSFQARCIQRIHAYLRVIHGFLRAQRVRFNELAVLFNRIRHVIPVRKCIVAGDPHQALVTRHWSQVIGYGDQDLERGRCGNAAHFAHLGIHCFSLCLRIQDEIPVDAEHVFQVVDGLKVLAIPFLLVARVQQILRVGSPLGQDLPHLLVIRGGFLEHLEPMEPHDVRYHYGSAARA